MLAQVLFDVIFSLLHCCDFLCILVGDLQLELFFERHDKFNKIERVSVQIFHERSARHNLAFINTELLNNNFLQTLMNGRHYFTSLSAFGMGCCWARLNIVPRTPLMKRLEVSLPKVLASSTASLIAALAGTLLLNRISYIASLRI